MDPKKEIKNLIEQILGSKVTLRDDVYKPDDELKKDFLHLLNLFENVYKRQDEMDQYGVDLTGWDDPYFKIIEGLIHFCFDEVPSRAILFYVYSRIDKKGKVIPFIDPFNMSHMFENTDDLWDFLLDWEGENMKPK
tara:strand:+ start:360 stop:767 length:408 start_codon:yes stop_codon:yes gene_type:complete